MTRRTERIGELAKAWWVVDTVGGGVPARASSSRIGKKLRVKLVRTPSQEMAKTAVRVGDAGRSASSREGRFGQGTSRGRAQDLRRRHRFPKASQHVTPHPPHRTSFPDLGWGRHLSSPPRS
jgi:hypothetical protein